MTLRDDGKALVRQMIAGDEAAFERFSDSYIPALYRFALTRLDRDSELTREIVQTVLCKAIGKLDSFRGEAALMTWLCAICRAEIAGHFRRQSRRGWEMELDAENLAVNPARGGNRSEDPERVLLDRERSKLVHIALDLLPPHYGQVLEWKYLKELSVKEIAGRLDVGPKAVESLLTRARQSFRNGFARLMADAEPAAAYIHAAEQNTGTES